MRAEEQLLVAFRGLARGIGARYANGRAERDDLNAVAKAGLLDSIRRFNPAERRIVFDLCQRDDRRRRQTLLPGLHLVSRSAPADSRDLTVPIRTAEARWNSGTAESPRRSSSPMRWEFRWTTWSSTRWAPTRPGPSPACDGVADSTPGRRTGSRDRGAPRNAAASSGRSAGARAADHHRHILLPPALQASIAAELGVSQVHVSPAPP